MNKPLKGFITYSHKDTEEKTELRKCLAVMEQNEELVTWDDGELTPGDKALPEDILEKVADSELLLYLVSAASLASTNCNRELTEAIEGNKRIIPIILEHCDWLGHQLSGFEVLPYKGKPLTKWDDKSEGWQNVVDGIRKVVEGQSEDWQNVVDGIRETVNEDEARNLSEPDPNKRSVEAAVEHGNFLLMLGEIDRAIEVYSHAIDLNPDFADAYNNRGLAYAAKSDFEAAIEDYSKAIDLNPELAEVYCNRGEAWLHLREWQKAKADLTTAKDMGYDIIASFRNDYESVEDFETKNKVKMPEDIAALLQQTNPSSKGAKYKCYMQKLIDELREKHNFTRARVGQPMNWYSFSSGIRGISYRVKFVEKDTEFAQRDTVRTYVNIHDDVQVNRFDLFDALEQRKEQIESAFGSPLEWERLEEQKRSRIVVAHDGNIELPDDELERIREWHIANLLKFKEVFQPEIKNALETLT